MADNVVVPPIQPPMGGVPGVVSGVTAAPVHPAGNPYGVDMNALVNQQFKGLDSQENRALHDQSVLDKEREASAQRHKEQIDPMNKTLFSMLDQKIPEREQVAFPERPKPTIDPQEYQGLSMALIGLALVGGAVSKGDWLGVSASLNGALKGYIDGNHEVAQREYDDYQRKFDAAKQQQNQIDKQFDSVLNNRSLTINDQLQKIQVIAAQHGLDDVAMQAKQKSIDGIIKQVEARRTQLLGIVQRKEAVDEKIQSSMQIASNKQATSSGKQAALTPEGAKLAGEMYVLGVKPSATGNSNQIINEMAKNGITAQDVATGKVTLGAAMQGEKQAVQRSQAVERLTGSVAQLQGRMQELVKKLNGYGVPMANKAINNIRSTVGSEDLSELRTLMASAARQYIEAVTMPGSNAQMHVGAQELADRMLHGDMNLNELSGVFKGINLEMKATSEQLKKQKQESLDMVGKKKDSSVIVPAVPSYHPEKEQRYQEWKKQHGGG